MSLLSMVEAQLPPGFRFHPRDDELICEYLAPKVAGDSSRRFSGCQMLIEIDLNKCEPWDLPEMASVGGKEWYFFSLKDRKYATGQRTNRATVSGYWKATGKDKAVVRKGQLIGMRKTLVFYQGRAPKGKNTDWVMHEFRLENPGHPPKHSFKEDWVLCRIFYKTRGISPKPSTHTSSHKNTGSPTLPNLADNYVTFGQTLPNLEGFEQVPCFSNYPLNPILPPQYFPIVERDLSQLTNVGGLPDLGSCLNPSVSFAEKKMFSKLRGNQRVEGNRSLAEEGSESFMSGLSVPSVWRSPPDW